MLGHVDEQLIAANTYPGSADFLYAIYNLIYIFHMPLFMMISGYVYRKAFFDAGGHSQKRKIYIHAANIFCVYFLFSLLWGVMKFVFARFTMTNISIMEIVQIPIKPIEIFWYLYVLFFLYLIFSLNIIERMNRWLLLGCTAAISLVGQFTHIELFAASKFMFFIFFFYLGYAYQKYGNKKSKKNGIMIWLMFIISAGFTAISWDKVRETPNFLGYDNYIRYVPVLGMISAIGVVLAIWWLFENMGFLSENKFLKYLGRCSLEIYLLHGFLITGLREVCNLLGVSNVYVSICLIFLFSVALPLLFSVICKRLGIYDLFFKPFSFFQTLTASDRQNRK